MMKSIKMKRKLAFKIFFEIGKYECLSTIFSLKCPETSDSFHELETHGKQHIDLMMEVEENTGDINRRYKCPNCAEVFFFEEDLEIHSKYHIKLE